MKKANKVIALILAMVLSLSALPVFAAASAVKDDVDTVEELIQGENLGNLVEWLLKNINNRKEEMLGTVLRLVFMFVEDEALQAKVGDTNLISAKDEDLAKILVKWLNSDILPGLQEDLASDDTVKSILKIVKIDVSSVDKIISSLHTLSTTTGLGDISKLNESALVYKKAANIFSKDTLVTVSNSGDLGALYSVLQFLSDNTDFFKKVIRGKVDLGLLAAANSLINDLIKENISPDAIKKMLCEAIELDYETYKKYTADEIAAVAFLKLLTGKDSVSRDDAAKVMNLSIYDFLETYAGDIYKNLLVKPLNEDVKQMLIEEVKPLDDEYGNILDQVFNWNYEFKEDTFDEYLGVGKGNLVDQLNNAVITLLKVILTDKAYKELNLKEGGNENLEENLTKAFRFILPKLAKLDNLGADLSGFTADKVKNMTAEEMAVGVLKLFFTGWFENAKASEVNKVKTLEQLAVLAAKYAVTNDEWVPVDIKAVSKAKNVEKLSDEACIDILFAIGMETAAKSLDYNKSTTYYELPADTSKWTAEDYLDDIVDWALNLADGLPASADILSTERYVLDGNGGFYKLNVILDSLFDLSFIQGCGNGTFSFDVETMLLDQFLGNLLNFEIDDAVAILAKNESSTLFNKKINVAVIDIVDDLLTGLFEEGYTVAKAGDVDMDGEIKAADARLALRASVGLENLDATQTKSADVDHDGVIKAADARLILRASVGLETL